MSKKEFADLPLNKQISYLIFMGILAPSTHNTQPWRFVLQSSSVDIYPDYSKRLPFADPTDRCLYISLGCCIENIVQAANYYGMETKLKHIQSKKLLFVNIQFRQSKKKKYQSNNIAETILKRKNSRGGYYLKRIPREYLNELTSLYEVNENVGLEIIEDDDRKGILTNLTVKGTVLAACAKGFRQELSNWVIPSDSWRKDGIPSNSLNVPDILSPVLPYIIRTFNMGKLTAKIILKNFTSSGALILVTSKKCDYKSWVEVGRLAELAMLLLQSKGLSTSISVAAIEMNLINSKILKKLKLKSDPQFVFSVGYSKATETTFSPRKDLLTMIMK